MTMMFTMVIRNSFSQKGAKNGYSFALGLTPDMGQSYYWFPSIPGGLPYLIWWVCAVLNRVLFTGSWLLNNVLRIVLFSVLTEQGVFLD